MLGDFDGTWQRFLEFLKWWKNEFTAVLAGVSVLLGATRDTKLFCVYSVGEFLDGLVALAG